MKKYSKIFASLLFVFSLLIADNAFAAIDQITMVRRGYGKLVDSNNNTIFSGTIYQSPSTYEVILCERDCYDAARFKTSIGRYAIYNPHYQIAAYGAIIQKSSAVYVSSTTSYQIPGYTFRNP